MRVPWAGPWGVWVTRCFCSSEPEEADSMPRGRGGGRGRLEEPLLQHAPGVHLVRLVQRLQAGVQRAPSLAFVAAPTSGHTRRVAFAPRCPNSTRACHRHEQRSTRGAQSPEPSVALTKVARREGAAQTAMVWQRSERGSCGAYAAGFDLRHRVLPGGVWLRRVSLVGGGCAWPRSRFHVPTTPLFRNPIPYQVLSHMALLLHHRRNFFANPAHTGC